MSSLYKQKFSEAIREHRHCREQQRTSKISPSNTAILSQCEKENNSNYPQERQEVNLMDQINSGTQGLEPPDSRRGVVFGGDANPNFEASPWDISQSITRSEGTSSDTTNHHHPNMNTWELPNPRMTTQAPVQNTQSPHRENHSATAPAQRRHQPQSHNRIPSQVPLQQRQPPNQQRHPGITATHSGHQHEVQQIRPPINIQAVVAEFQNPSLCPVDKQNLIEQLLHNFYWAGYTHGMKAT